MSALKLYVVDNDEDDREVFREVLTELACDMHLYSSGEALLDQLSRESRSDEYRLFILDITAVP